MAEVTSQIKAFLRDRCVLEKGAEVRTEDLYAAYVVWARDRGHRMPMANNQFGTRIRAAEPSIYKDQLGRKAGRKHAYFNVRLADDNHVPAARRLDPGDML